MKLFSEPIIRGPLHLLLNYVSQVAINHFAHIGYNNFRLVNNKTEKKNKKQRGERWKTTLTKSTRLVVGLLTFKSHVENCGKKTISCSAFPLEIFFFPLPMQSH